MLPENIIDDAIKAGAYEDWLEWAKSPDATIGTVPNDFRCWWVQYLTRHLTSWWDGKCCTYTDGTREQWRHGQRHCDYGPAVECPDGTREQWRHGVRVSVSHPR